MSAAYYIPGTLYTVGANPVLKLLNVRNTRTFSEFIVRGANAGPLIPGMKVRLRNYPTTNGPEVFPYGRATGQPGMEPATLDPFWATACSPVGALSVASLADYFLPENTVTQTIGQATSWTFALAAPRTQAILGYSSANPENALGTHTYTTCLTNDTTAAVVPKILFSGSSLNVTGSIEMTWNDTLVLSRINSSAGITGGTTFSAPSLPPGITATSVIQIKSTSITALSGTITFRVTL